MNTGSFVRASACPPGQTTRGGVEPRYDRDRVACFRYTNGPHSGRVGSNHRPLPSEGSDLPDWPTPCNSTQGRRIRTSGLAVPSRALCLLSYTLPI